VSCQQHCTPEIIEVNILISLFLTVQIYTQVYVLHFHGIMNFYSVFQLHP